MSFWEIFHNRIFWAAAASWAVAQAIKFVLTLTMKKKLDTSRLYGSGGMPSSHSSLVMALTFAVGKNLGFGSPEFAISLVLSFIVMYDAAGVRRAAGKQAQVLNALMTQAKLPTEAQLKELLGHTPIQVVAGAALGIVMGLWLG